ncbi:MAG: type II toxin-antitoxin system prevent-host-death family antitoxin [Bryobacteraceae bacterium]|jgi:prevent-host-death family protein
MITRSISEARRELGKLIEQARQGQDVVIIKDSRPVAALRPIDDTDLDLTPELTDAQVQALWKWSEAQPSKTFSSPEAAVKYLKQEFAKPHEDRSGGGIPSPLPQRKRGGAIRRP